MGPRLTGEPLAATDSNPAERGQLRITEAGIARLGDMCTGHGCFPFRPTVQGSHNVFINGIPAHRQGDYWPTHCCSDSCHDGVLARGSSSVFCNGVELGRIGDPVSCGSHVAIGSTNVFCGDGQETS